MNNIKLPEEYKQRMKNLLKEDYEKYIDSLEMTPIKGLRVNTALYSNDSFEKLNMPVHPIKSLNGCYVLDDHTMGKHPYHHAGMYYIQEPSAMLPANSIEIKEDWVILDMCSAPGGKMSQLSSFVKQGMVLANEINKSRCTITLNNIERLGLDNVILSCMRPEEIAKYYSSTFDLVLVDAPCSGEGMFRKNNEAIDEWSVENVEMCAERQKKIIDEAVKTLKTGGYLIYSTCTFSIEENEKMVEYCCEKHNMQIIDVRKEIMDITSDGISFDNESLKKARRVYPFLGIGEGQFFAAMQKLEDNNTPTNEKIKYRKLNELSKSESKIVQTFLEKETNIDEKSIFQLNNNIISLKNFSLPIPEHGIISCGVKLGEIKKDRFVPHHHFFKAYGKEFKCKLNLDASDPRVISYLKGLEIESSDTPDSWGVLLVDDCVLGGFKANNGVLKNHYPKGLRLKG